MQIIVYKLVDAFNHVTLSDYHFAFLTILERGNKANVRNIVFLSPCGYESYHKDSTEKIPWYRENNDSASNASNIS